MIKCLTVHILLTHLFQLVTKTYICTLESYIQWKGGLQYVYHSILVHYNDFGCLMETTWTSHEENQIKGLPLE
jgi:hypothetical protein